MNTVLSCSRYKKNWPKENSFRMKKKIIHCYVIKNRNRGRASESPIKLTQSDNNQYQYQNFQSRARIDARLWLQARMVLVRSLVSEVTGMGDIKGKNFVNVNL